MKISKNRCNMTELGQNSNNITRSSILSLFNFNLFRSIQVSISRTQASNLYLLSSISLRDDVSKLMLHTTVYHLH